MCLAVPGKIVSINDNQNDPLLRSGRVSFGGIIKEVSLAYLPEAQVGQYVIVHVGFALTILDEAEAEATLNYLAI
ncbi:MAG: HypC/HybG/HupF family hydrogenase formation chaperone [Gloeocapsa sp. DLM2.Bin57]|nr:MAG: HypC/HybG/HupF family hydrogenase formation chaperone [Gloeocapsa sp. DLM2.Bin57]